MIDKRRDLEQKIMEESLYAELWKQDMMIKQAKEQRELEVKKQLKQETLGVLDWQKT